MSFQPSRLRLPLCLGAEEGIGRGREGERAGVREASKGKEGEQMGSLRGAKGKQARSWGMGWNGRQRGEPPGLAKLPRCSSLPHSVAMLNTTGIQRFRILRE